MSNKIKSNLIAAPHSAPNDENRKIAAQLIYAEYGASVLYKQNNSITVFEPTEIDINKYQETMSLMKQGNEIKQELIRQNQERFYLSQIQLILFAIIFSLVYSFQRNATKES